MPRAARRYCKVRLGPTHPIAWPLPLFSNNKSPCDCTTTAAVVAARLQLLEGEQKYSTDCFA